MKGKRWIKYILRSFVILFILVNLIVLSHAYHFTHFDTKVRSRTRIENQTTTSRAKMLLTGVQLPRPRTRRIPKIPYKTHFIKSDVILESWDFPVNKSNTIVLMFHGYGGEKSSLLANSALFNAMGYQTILTDFRGAGGSKGNTTALGYKEARDVKVVYDFAKKTYPKKKVVFYGFSMGAVAILKAASEYDLDLRAIIAEAPFASLRQATINRFEMMGLPAHPFTEALIFYGGLLQGFNAFEHSSVEYAKKVTAPCLIQRGANDKRVNSSEINAIYQALEGPKQSVTYPNSGHFYYLWNDKGVWVNTVQKFIMAH